MVEMGNTPNNRISDRKPEVIFEHPKKTVLAFGLGALTDQMSHQAFQLLVFTFYYAVIGVNVDIIGIAFIIFAVWDSINDPLLGTISDKTKSRFGRRGFWILISIIPFGIINLLLFTPPGLTSPEWSNALYMFIIIMAYDFFYTLFSGNETALFPEMFKTEEIRSRANIYKNILTVIGVLIGFVLPTVIINPMAPSSEVPAEKIITNYITTGALLCGLVIVFGLLFFKFGVIEDPQEITRPHEMPPILKALKETLKNKTFMIFITANLFIWFVFKMLTTILPLYAQYVLKTGKDNFIITAMLLIAFLSATAFFPVMQKIGLKWGMRNGLIISQAVWLFAMIPFAFFGGPEDWNAALLCMVFAGFGLSGAMYYVDIIISSIIDENEVKTGKRREGAFYGVNALINRYSTILVFVAIMLVLHGYGWADFLTEAGSAELSNFETGLKILMAGFPIGALLIIIILLKIFPLHGKYLEEINAKLREIRKEKGIIRE